MSGGRQEVLDEFVLTHILGVSEENAPEMIKKMHTVCSVCFSTALEKDIHKFFKDNSEDYILMCPDCYQKSKEDEWEEKGLL